MLSFMGAFAARSQLEVSKQVKAEGKSAFLSNILPMRLLLGALYQLLMSLLRPALQADLDFKRGKAQSPGVS